jgi:methyl-accepting chemotaxis protein
MLKFIANLKISIAISLLVVGAFIAIGTLASQIIIRDMNNVKSVTELSQLGQLSIKMSALLHESQKERGYTAGFYGSKGAKMGPELEKQRVETDAKKSDLIDFANKLGKDVYGKEFDQRLSAMLANIAKMGDNRSGINSFSIERAAGIGYYTKLNSEIIDYVAYMANLIDSAKISLSFVSYSNYMANKEYAGIERAFGAGGFAAGIFTPAELGKMRDLIATQNAYKAVFLTYATAEEKSLYEKLMNDSPAKEAARMEEIAFENIPEKVATVSAGLWIDTMTRKLDGMREVEELFAKDLVDAMAASSVEADSSQVSNLTMVAITVALIALFSYAIAHAIISSLNNVAKATEALAGGNLNADIPRKTNNEVGKIVAALAIFKENALQVAKLKVEQEEKDKAAIEEKRRAMHQMADSFEASVKSAVSQVASSATQMQAGAESVNSIAEDTKKRSGVVVNAATEAAQTSAQVAAATEELTASIGEISVQTQKSSQIANDAASKAEFASNAINLLSEKSTSVAQIIEVITGIAGQINLLALNATIESARAGEAGKGFAVVASEVKNLASQVGKATGEITQQINEMQGATKTSVDSVMDILNIINQVSVSTSAVASAVEEQSAVTTEIANNVARTSSGTQEISQNMAFVQEGAEKTGDTAAEVLQSAKNLNQQSNTLKEKVDEFLRTIRNS